MEWSEPDHHPLHLPKGIQTPARVKLPGRQAIGVCSCSCHTYALPLVGRCPHLTTVMGCRSLSRGQGLCVVCVSPGGWCCGAVAPHALELARRLLAQAASAADAMLGSEREVRAAKAAGISSPAAY